MLPDILTRGRKAIELADIGEQADRAKTILARVRQAMLAPDAQKQAPRISVGRMGVLTDLDTRQVDHRARSGKLPPGAMNAAGTRREFSLADTRVWCRELRASRMRPPGGATEAVVLAVANFKGGVSKTTTAMVLAQGLSLRGHRVLVVDCDPQGSLTTLFGILPDAEVEPEQTILPLCLGREELISYAIRPTYWDGIDLVPATSVLFSAEFALPARQKREANFAFWEVLSNGLEMARQDYDVIVIDTPPALSYVTINAMMAADGLIMPLPPSALDFASSVQFWDLFFDLGTELGVHERRPKRFEFINVLLSKVDSSDISSSVVKEWIAAAYGDKVLPIEIPKTATAGNAAAEFGTAFDLKAGTTANRTMKRALEAYDGLVLAIEAQLVAVWARQAQEFQ
jgi:chromosome partitioning protein